MIRREEATTEEYLVKRQSIKTSKANNTDSKSPTNSSKTVNNEVTCKHCVYIQTERNSNTHYTQTHQHTSTRTKFPVKTFLFIIFFNLDPSILFLFSLLRNSNFSM